MAGPETAMNFPNYYPVGALVVSVVAFVLLGLHLTITSFEYREYHDERAARGLLLGLVLAVSALGTMISSIGLFVDSADFSLVGLGMLRGALLVGGVTLVLMDRKVGHT